MTDIQFPTLDSGLLPQETKTTFSGLRNKLRIKELTTKTSNLSYLKELLLLTTLNQTLESIATVKLKQKPSPRKTKLEPKMMKLQQLISLMSKLHPRSSQRKRVMMTRKKNELAHLIYYNI